MKGYELYSWQQDGQWVFSLLVGTNREKTLDEIQSPQARLTLDALENGPENPACRGEHFLAGERWAVHPAAGNCG
jgi:hypothetical protein